MKPTHVLVAFAIAGLTLSTSPALAADSGAPAVAACDGDHTVSGADGKKQDCSPYKCASNATCLSTCLAKADCVGDTVCESGACVFPTPPQATDEGCSATGASSTNGGDAWGIAGWLVAAVALVVVRRRRPVAHRLPRG